MNTNKNYFNSIFLSSESLLVKKKLPIHIYVPFKRITEDCLKINQIKEKLNYTTLDKIEKNMNTKKRNKKGMVKIQVRINSKFSTRNRSCNTSPLKNKSVLTSSKLEIKPKIVIGKFLSSKLKSVGFYPINQIKTQKSMIEKGKNGFNIINKCLTKFSKYSKLIQGIELLKKVMHNKKHRKLDAPLKSSSIIRNKKSNDFNNFSQISLDSVQNNYLINKDGLQASKENEFSRNLNNYLHCRKKQITDNLIQKCKKMIFKNQKLSLEEFRLKRGLKDSFSSFFDEIKLPPIYKIFNFCTSSLSNSLKFNQKNNSSFFK